MYLWQFDNDKPIYKQLVEKLEIWIINGTYPPGSKLPSVRELAEEKSIGLLFKNLDNLITLHQRGENIDNRRQ